MESSLILGLVFGTVTILICNSRKGKNQQLICKERCDERKKEFCEEFGKKEKIKGIILVCIYVFLLSVTLEQLHLDNSYFIRNNPSFVGVGFLFLLVLILFWSTILEAIKHLKLKKIGEILITWLIVVICMALLAIIVDFLGIPNHNEMLLNNERLNANFPLYAITLVVLGPTVEEIIFRFIIFRALREKNIVIAHVVVTIIFAFMHVDINALLSGEYMQLFNMLVYIPLSVGTVILYERNKSLIYPIILHMALNFYATM